MHARGRYPHRDEQKRVKGIRAHAAHERTRAAGRGTDSHMCVQSVINPREAKEACCFARSTPGLCTGLRTIFVDIFII
jgi:hypothetical protein